MPVRKEERSVGWKNGMQYRLGTQVPKKTKRGAPNNKLTHLSGEVGLVENQWDLNY